MPERLEVQRAVAAPAGKIFAPAQFRAANAVTFVVNGALGGFAFVFIPALEIIAGGTLVTSYYDWSGAEQAWKDGAIFPVIPEGALRATLGILARTVAPGKPRPVLSTP
jgi:hypothetical protein